MIIILGKIQIMSGFGADAGKQNPDALLLDGISGIHLGNKIYWLVE